jgi:tetratricopeptide (TPR) repeat protein
VHTTRYEEAAALIEKANEITPGEAAILDSLGWVYFKLGRYTDALGYLRQAYQMLPDPEVAAHLGETLWVMGYTEDAFAIWQDALTRVPNNPLVIDTMTRLGAGNASSD